MATIVLAAAGSAIGAGFGGTILGMSGAVIGRFVGATVGNIIDNMLLAKDVPTHTEGARLKGAQYVTSTEGAVITTVLGRYRVAGQVIWGTDFVETVVTDRTERGGKGGPKQVSTTTSYIYSTSFAVGLCEGAAGASISRAWADGNELDLYGVTYRFYDGSQTAPDSLIEAVEGAGATPAFKGTAYIVFENLELTDYGNRVPQITVEILVPDQRSNGIEDALRAVCLIPGAGEYALSTTPVTITHADGHTSAPCNHVSATVPDLVVALDNLRGEAPNVSSVSLVVSWFGTDTNAADCDVKPMVEYHDTTSKFDVAWKVGGHGRADYDAMPLDDHNRPICGGTPSDRSVREAVTEAKARGLRVSFYPFILMVSEGIPWRGRITGDAAAYLGTCVPGNFTRSGDTVNYSGPAEWSHRRMILHYARLLSDKLTSGDIFLVGSEMVGLTESGTAWGTGLAALIADVRAILPAGVEVSYASNWDEYDHATLAPVWSAADFVGIDYYMPLTDWRECDEVYTVDAFAAGCNSGELWDYHYLSDEDREAGVRTPITGAVWRQKDIGYWRDNNAPTKRIVFTEVGCPAIDKGGNQPNVFYDAKSSESQIPYFSTGARNDAVQRCYLEGVIQYCTESGLVDPADIFVWAWDARPYPSFPGLPEVWGDAENYVRGHWISGRTNTWSFEDAVRWFADTVDFPSDRLDFSGVAGLHHRLRGLKVDSISSPRDVIQDLMSTFNVASSEHGGVISFFLKSASPSVAIDTDDLVAETDMTRARVKDTDLPDQVEVTSADEYDNYENMSVSSVSVTGRSYNVASVQTGVLIDEDYAFSLANVKLNETWIARETIGFSLPFGSPVTGVDYYSMVVPGAWFDLGMTRYQVSKVTVGDRIEVEAGGFSPDIYNIEQSATVGPSVTATIAYGSSTLWFVDLPLKTSADMNPWSPRLAAYQNPWPMGVAVYDDDHSGGYTLNTVAGSRAVMGVTTAPFAAGVLWRWDRANSLSVRLYNSTETLTAATEASVLNGANTLAVETATGMWEVIQFRDVTVNPDGSYTLSTLLRGQCGTDADMAVSVQTGARVVLYDDRLGVLTGSSDRLGVELALRYGPSVAVVSDTRFKDETVTPAGVAIRPYAPVHLRQTHSGADLVLSWIRRTRFGGDSWDQTEVPLNEESERYVIDILDGAAVKRTIAVDAATVATYTSAQQIADFGSAQSSVSWVVYQISTVYGRGAPAHG